MSATKEVSRFWLYLEEKLSVRKILINKEGFMSVVWLCGCSSDG